MSSFDNNKPYFFSQQGEDLLIYRNFINTHVKDGVFLELGACDGLLYSNTLFFEKYLGFKGILIEPVKEFYDKLIKNRPNNSCYNNAISLHKTDIDILVNGAVSGGTTITVDGVSGTIATGQVVTVQDTSTLAISDADSNTAISTNNSLTITAVASQTSVTVSEAITVADDVVLLAMADGGEEMIVDALGFKVAGPQFDSRSDITTITRTGADDSVALQLEEATTSSFIDELSNDGGRLVQETGNAASITDGINLEGQDSVQTDPYVVETSLNDAATFSRTGSSSGTASVLKGITVAAS